MSVNSQIQRIATAKENLKTAINAKGGELTDELIDAYADAVTNLPEGEETVAGYFINTDGTITFQPLESGAEAESVSEIKIVDTGVDEPQYDGVSTHYYKCASVDSVNHVWAGYLASIDSVTGVWTFSANVTSGLTYTYLTPVVGNVYAGENCICQVTGYKTSIPTDGLIFYLPLDEYPGNTDATGQHSLDYQNASNISYGQQVNGVTGAILGYEAAIRGPDFSSIIQNDASAAFTLSCWFYNSTYVDFQGAFGFTYQPAGSTTNYEDVYVGCRRGYKYSDGANRPYYQVFAGERTVESCGSDTMDGLHHVLITYYNNDVVLYIDGAFASQGSYYTTDRPFRSFSVWCPDLTGYKGNSTTIFFSAFRIYNRVLDSAEITALASEFTPTAE